MCSLYVSGSLSPRKSRIVVRACLRTLNWAVAADVRRLHHLVLCASLLSEVIASSRRLLLFIRALRPPNRQIAVTPRS